MSLTTPADLDGGPPKKDDLKLMDMPTEILDEILHFTLYGNTLLCISNKADQRKLYWHQSWVAGLFQVSKKFGACVRTIASAEVVLYVSESERGKHMLVSTLTEDEERDHFLELGPFPEYFQQKADAMVVQQSKIGCMFRMDRLNVDAFPNLRLLRINAPTLQDVCAGLSAQIVTGVAIYRADLAVRKLIGFTREIVSCTSANKQNDVLELLANSHDADAGTVEGYQLRTQLLCRAVGLCISSEQNSYSGVAKYIVCTMMGLSWQSFKGLNEHATVQISFDENIDGEHQKASNSEHLLLVWSLT